MKKPIQILLLLLATLAPWAATAQTSQIYTSYTATAGSSGINNQDYPMLVDNNINTKWCVDYLSGSDNLSLYIEFQSAEPIIPTGYVLTTADDTYTYPGRNPKNWTLKAKANPNDVWTTIATVTNDHVLQGVSYADFEFTVNNPNHATYKYFRFDISAIQSGECFQLAELKFLTLESRENHIGSTSTSTQITWDEFAQAVNSGYTYEGQTVYLDSDVTATTMVGTQANPFCGTFEGNGKTITLSGGEFGTSSSYASQEGVSPFYWIVNNARIKNLHIAGNIYSSNKHAAGFCYATQGNCTIYNCRSSVTIYSTAETEAGCGFVAQPRWYSYDNNVTTIEGCVFDGAIIGSGSQCGGFVNYPNKAVNITNCLFAPSYMTIGASGSYMFHQINGSATVTLTNCYYSTPWGATAQGKKAYTITGQSPATVAMNGTATNYNVSHITAYSGTPGLVYNGTIIAGEGDQVSLNLESNYDYLYAVDHGTLTGTTNPYRLTMDAYNTTITGFSSVPYADDFESSCVWQLLNGDRINQWCYGTTASNGTGTHGLYISNDGGTTNAYTDVGTAYASGMGDNYFTTVYATKMFHFEEGAYNITFDWRALGHWEYDYMRVALVPASVNLEAGAYTPAGFSNNTLPEGWLALDGGQKLNQSAEWQTHSSEFWVPALGNYKVVFAWRNSVWDGSQPPAAIDNVSVTAITCSTPFNLVATNINATAADLNWNGSPDVDSYTLMYRTAEDIGAQFKEDFESDVSFANWQAFGSSNTGNNFGRRTAAARTGSYGFSFSSRFQAAQYSQYLISPELSATGDLEFYFRASENNSREFFYVGYSSTGNNVDDFVWGQRYSSTYNSYWRHFQETIPEGTKYIAIHYTAQYQYELYIDDLTIGAYEVQAGEWQTTTVEGGSMNMEATLSGLTPETLYETYVYPDCNPDKLSEVTKFKTREICPVPTNVTVGNYTANSADLSWTAVIEVANYTVKYRTIPNGEWQTLSVAGNAAEASITLMGLTQGTTYEAQVKSDCSDPEKWSETVWFTVPTLCDVPTALSATPMLESANLTWEGDQESYIVQYRPITQGEALFFDDFESGDLSSWTIVDADGDGLIWSSHINTGMGDHTAYSGNGVAYSQSYDNVTGAALTPDNWLITPQVELGGFVSFWAVSQDSYYSEEHFAIYVSTTGTDPDDFTQISPEYVSTGAYTKYTALLNAYSGMGYVAIRHFNVIDRFALNIDDFGIYALGDNEWMERQTTEATLNITGLDPVTNYEWHVQGINPYCNNGVTDWSEVNIFQTHDYCDNPNNIVVDDLTATSATISWTGYQDSYNVWYRIAKNMKAVSFEDTADAQGDWTTDNLEMSNMYGYVSGWDTFIGSFTFVNTTNPPQTLISPELNIAYNNSTLIFDYLAYIGYIYPQTFKVGFSSTDNNVDSFTWGDEITVTNSEYFETYFVPVPDNAKYFAIQCTSYDKSFFILDNFVIGGQYIPAGEWQEVTVNEPLVTLDGLSPETKYEFSIQGICGDVEYTEKVDGSFTTQSIFTKEIVGYGSGNANWYLIASPYEGETDPADMTNMLIGNYDLFRFSPSHEGEEWENYENGNFSLVNGQGYLYANREDVILNFSDAPITGNEPVEVPLTYDATDDHKCWNLVGNPFPCKATINKPYYVLDAEGTGINPEPQPAGTIIPPYTAVFVKALGAGQTVVFTKVVR